MKKYLLLSGMFFLMLITSLYSQQQNWSWQNPLPQGNALYTVNLMDENIVYTVGNAGTVMKSSDGGTNWSILNTSTVNNLRNAEFFQNGMIGYAIGEKSTVIKTSDGGNNWVKINVNPDYHFFAIDFIDENTGFVGGIPGNSIFKTTDGGTSWLQYNSIDIYAVQTIIFIDNLTGFAAGWLGMDSVIYKTTDGGVSWIQKTMPIQTQWDYIKSFCFVNNQVGYAAGTRTILKTIDSGETWNISYTGTASFNSICFPENETIGYVVGDFNTALKTTDGGTIWQTINTNVSSQHFYNSVNFLNNQVGFIVGMHGIILKTTDGGLNWLNLLSNVSLGWQMSVDFPINSQTGYIAGMGQYYRILKTINGGNTWTQQTINSSAGLRKIKFLDNETGYVVGDNGVVFKTTDGGQNWNYLYTGFNQLLFDVEFPVNSITGFVSGELGRLIKTTDGGSTWNSIGSFNKDIMAMCFPLDNLVGYVATSYGRIYKTTDGGLTWETKYDGNSPPTNITDILFPFDDQTGYALYCPGGGQITKILKTTDGGNNWAITESGTTDELFSISFPTPQVGYIGGANYEENSATFLKTIDGGSSWNFIKVPYSYSIMSVCFPNEIDTGYVVGNLSGAILKTLNGGGIITSIFDPPVEQIVSDYTLFQNYPNPFNPSTNISFQLPVSSAVTLKVYDVLGNEVAILVDEFKSAGSYEVEFNSLSGSHQLASGIYFYQLKVGDLIHAKKMILMK
jgi:photosystem II stability/assembly factor-like uncharacterized protein